MTKPILEVNGVIKEFPGVRALKGVHFDVREGEVHALCGENGAGKSTLMHILAGVYKPEAGEIFLSGEKIAIQNQKHAHDLGISIVYQERSLVKGLSVAENIFAGRQPVTFASKINFKLMEDQSQKLLQDLGIDINPKVKVGSLTPALQQMVEIAKALSLNPKVLILDEPTATITENEVAALFALVRRLKDQGIAIVYISHRLAEIFEIADRVTVYKDGEYVATSDVKDIDSMWIVNKMVGRDLKFQRSERSVSDEVVLECKDFNGGMFHDINFNLRKGEILGFAGLAGAGRTEVMRAIFGADPIYSGTLTFKGKEVKIQNCVDAIKTGIGYLPEDRKEQGVFLEMAISSNIVSGSLDKMRSGINLDNNKVLKVAEEYVKRLNIITPSIRQKVVNLSGGNQQKVVMAKWLLVRPEILIVDEPTRGIDVGAKSEIYNIIRKLTEEGISIIMVSSDLPEIIAISDRIYVMHEGAITGEINGDEANEEIIMRYASGIKC